MDSNLLKQLIAQHRRVVIPDFGAFLKKETPNGEELVFSPFLRKDDGTVTDAIVREYGVETEDARAMVAEFVIYLRQSLASSGRYYIEGVGMLAADANGTVTLKEGEAPEPEPVEPEAVPEPVSQQIKPQPVPQQVQQTQPAGFARPVQPQVQPAVQQAQPLGGGITRPQSIQVQPQPQTGQPAVPPIAPMQQMPGQAGYPHPQRPVMPGAGIPQQPMVRPQSMPGIGQQQPFPRPQQGQGQQPIYGVQQQGAAMQGQAVRGGQAPVPPAQRQPQAGGMQQRGGQEPISFRRGGGAPGSNGAGRGPGGPTGPNGKPGQPQRRPAPPRRRPQKNKTDVWLIVAIIAALVVIAIMIYGFINTGKNDMDELNFNMSAQPQDTTALMDSGTGDW